MLPESLAITMAFFGLGFLSIEWIWYAVSGFDRAYRPGFVATTSVAIALGVIFLLT